VEPQRVGKSYAREAACYDRRWQSYWGSFYDYYEGALVTQLISSRVPENARILDIPVGTARLLSKVREGLPKLRCVGADLTPEMLRVASEKLPQDTCSFVSADARTIPFASNTFDFVLSIRFFHLIPAARHMELVEEMIRVVKPGGYLLIEFNNPLYGLFLGAAFGLRRRLLHGTKGPVALWPQQVRSLTGPHWRIVEQLGVYWPGQGRLFRIAPRLATALGRLGHLWPLRYLTLHTLVCFQKTGSSETIAG